MRRILTDFARSRESQTRRHGEHVPLDEAILVWHTPRVDLLELDEAAHESGGGRSTQSPSCGGLRISLVDSVVEETAEGVARLSRKTSTATGAWRKIGLLCELTRTNDA